MGKMALHNLAMVQKFIVFKLLCLGFLYTSAMVEASTIQDAVNDATDAVQQHNPVPSQTVQGWRQAVDSLIVVSDLAEQAPNASYKFNACFLKDGQCAAHSQAYRDEFRKLTYYYAPSKRSVPQNHVTFYLSLKDDGLPKLVMRFTYVGQAWLYIDAVAILVDGDVIFQQEIPEAHIERQAVTGTLLYEYGDLLMNDRLDVVERLAQADAVAVRISGRGGEAYLDEGRLVNMQLQAGEIQLMYELLQEAIKDIAADVPA